MKCTTKFTTNPYKNCKLTKTGDKNIVFERNNKLLDGLIAHDNGIEIIPSKNPSHFRKQILEAIKMLKKL